MLQKSATLLHSAAGISFTLTRKKVKNLNLRIHEDGSVHVSAPNRVPLSQVEAFVASRANWIEARQKALALRQAQAQRLWQGGEQLRLWGEELTLSLEKASSSRTEGAAREGNQLRLLVVERWLDNSEASLAHREKLVRSWQEQQLRDALPPLFERYEAQLGVHAQQLRLRRMKTRWGSCNVKTATITLNSQLVELPPCCLESVLVHELCHLIVASHNDRFHALMDRHYPSWREARKLLNAESSLSAS